MVSDWSLSQNKSSQVSRTLLSILADLNNTEVWMVSAHLLISRSSSPFTNPLMTLPNYYSPLVSFSNHCHLEVVHWNVSDSKPLQASRDLLSILTDLNIAVVLMVSILPHQVRSASTSLLLLLLLLLNRVFHTSVSWWSFTGDWVIASLLKSPGLFSVFWPSSIMLFGWSLLDRQLPNPPGSLIIL